MPSPIQWFLAAIILAAYTFVVWLFVDFVTSKLANIVEEKRNRKTRQRLTSTIKSTLEIYEGFDERLDSIERAFNDIYKHKKNSKIPPSLIEELSACHTSLLENRIDFEAGQIKTLLELANYLDKESPYDRLPSQDKKVIVPLRIFLESLNHDNLTSAFLTNLTDLLSDKNKEIEHLKVEISRVVLKNRRNFVLTIISLIVGLLGTVITMWAVIKPFLFNLVQ